ncbi:hypothetical protein E0H73_39725 [Kribbella pittospori]|uniref:Uncharacterized protein n=1 Tax=Kribbella pittospori TaxID=722689 RepID=A0A4R0K4M7_9ACTN|nr:hypothetical protein [Kribbella pittospori]TCC54280.1 hypothetical protein E0H73_39725 [Kribbella pittospori]
MTTSLQQEIERWEAQLDTIAETNVAENWFLEERRLAEASRTITAFRVRILPSLTNARPYEAIVGDEIVHRIDRLQDLRDDLLRTVHPDTCRQEISETLAELHALARLALRFERTADAVR